MQGLRLHKVKQVTLGVACFVGMLATCPAWSQTTPQVAGSIELNLLQLFLTGNYGFFIGLATAFVGIFRLAAQGDTKGGIILVVLGVLFTMLPAIFNGTRIVVCPIVRVLAPTAQCSWAQAPQQSPAR